MDLEHPMIVKRRRVPKLKLGREHGISLALQLLRRTLSRSVSELFDKCTYNEWKDLTCYAGYHELIKVAIELRSKELLDMQRENMMGYVAKLVENIPIDYEQFANFSEIFTINNIMPFEFAEYLAFLLLKSDHKINAMRFFGVPNSCKTLIANCISAPFVCCYMNNHGSENEFFLSNMLNKSIIHCEELYVTTATCEDFKCILGGQPLDVSKKFNEKQLLSRTPIIITTNHTKFGRGHLGLIDEEALRLRCYNFNFVKEFKPSCTLTWQQFYKYCFSMLPDGAY